ncbi:MAG: helix-turn-helix transcriptional regulator [Clostridia bacterium]|nr:helix-turn-helix transcriptional regulator [Clostridia bacterium]
MTETQKGGQLIRRYRQERKYSLEKLAEYCELSDRSLSDIERGISIPKASTLLDICRVLHIDAGDLAELYQRIDTDE